MQDIVNCDSINGISFFLFIFPERSVSYPSWFKELMFFVNDLLEEYILLKGESVLVCIYNFMTSVFKAYVLRFGRNLIII